MLSIEDDRVRWNDSAERILNLQQSTGQASVTNLNVVLDNLNALDYTTTVVERKEDALSVLSKCCTLVIASGSDEFLITKLCQLVVNLLSKQKVSLDQETLNVLLNFFVQSIKSCKWTLLDLLRALGATLYGSGSMCSQFAETLLGKGGVLMRLCLDQMQDTDVQCGAVQCIGNICVRSTSGSCLGDKFVNKVFDLLLNLLRDSPKQQEIDAEHLRLVNAVLHALQHVLSLGCSAQKIQLGPLLAALKNYMFCGMPGYKPAFAEKNNQRTHYNSAIEPDDLSSVHLDTMPQKDRTYSALSRKKRRTNNKKTYKKTIFQGPRMYVENSSVDALTPAFAACNLTCPLGERVYQEKRLGEGCSSNTHLMNNHGPRPVNRSSSVDALTPAFAGTKLTLSPKKPGDQEKQSEDRHPDRQRQCPSEGDSNHSVRSNSSERSDAGMESSGYASASSLSATSSDSEYSDSDVGQQKRLRSLSSRVRLNVLICLQAVIKSTDKKILFGYWSSFVPDSTVASSWSLFTIILKDSTPKCRACGVEVLMDLLDGSRQFLVAAGDREDHNSTTPERPFTSFSVKLSGIVRELHRCLLQAFVAETSPTTKPQILKCLSILVLNSPYNRLKEGLLSRIVKQLRPLLTQKDTNLQAAVLSCLKVVVSVHTPLPEVIELMRPPLIEIKGGTKAVALFRDSGSSSRPSIPDSSCTTAFPDLELPPDSPWLVAWCAHAASRPETTLVVRLEALQLLGAFVRSYVFLTSSCVWFFKSLACYCLADSDHAFAMSAMKLLEELVRAMYAELTDSHSAGSTITKEQLAEFWRTLLEEPLISFLQGDNSSLSRLRCAAVDCLSNIGPIMFEELLLDKRILCITLLLGLSNDEDKNIKASAIRALGVLVSYPCLRDDVLFVSDTANAVLNTIADTNLNVRMKAAWTLANLSDTLVVNLCADDLRFMEDFSDKLLLKLLNTSIIVAEDNEKVKSNAVRALGNFLLYIRAPCLEKKGFLTAMEKAVQALVDNVNSGVMKVRWNACYAMGNVLRNPCLPIGTAPWTGAMYKALENVICDCKNFKVRINAVLALSVPQERRYYGNITLYSDVYETLINALKSTETVTEFSEFRFCDSLRQQLCNSLCHMTRLMTSEDAACLGCSLEENHDIIKKYVTDYIRQLVSQENAVEEQANNKTSVEKWNALRETHRHVQEDLMPSAPATKILQDIFCVKSEN